MLRPFAEQAYDYVQVNDPDDGSRALQLFPEAIIFVPSKKKADDEFEWTTLGLGWTALNPPEDGRYP